MVQQKKLLEEWILEQPSSVSAENKAWFDPRWMCIAVWGLGGLGKTTILEQIFYPNTSLTKQFHCTAWITVSKTYKIRDLLSDLSRKLAEPTKVSTDNKSVEGLISLIHEIVDKKRYLIVFDDVWSDDFWSQIQTVFRSHDYNLGSRILFTTRDEKVALSVAKKDRVMLLSHLNEQQAWSLFCKKAFWQEHPQTCPPHLESCGREIVKKCKGLPLAIITVAGMVSTKDRNELKWEKFCKMLDTELGGESELSIFMRSYYNLPLHLKSCFLYCSTWPEDWCFPKFYIIWLWAAEGFIEERSGMTLEDTGEDYMEELVRRSMMIQQKRDDSEYTYYKMHDIFRVVGLKVSQGQNFATIVDGDHENCSTNPRRLQIYKPIGRIPNLPKLRSLTVNCSFPEFSFHNFKLLKVLSLPDFPMSYIPEEIFDLFNLRYLYMRGARIKEVPSKIGRLQNLHLLDILRTEVKRLPRDIGKLQKLRVLLCGEYYSYGVQVPAEIFYLENLQCLSNIEANVEVVEKLGGLTKLRELGITDVKPSHEEQLSSSFKRMEHLIDLHLSTASDESPVSLESLNLTHASRIVLRGAIEGIPTWFRSLQSLEHLYLGNSNIQHGGDLVDNMKFLSCLQAMVLENTFQGTKLTFPSGCFQSLELLQLGNLNNLTCVEIETSALPNLRRIKIYSCAKLTSSIVGEVEKLKRLEEIILEGLAPDVLQDFQRILQCKIKLKVIER